MQYYEIIIPCNAELIEVFVIKFQPVITNRVIIMNSVVKVTNKDPDKIVVPYGKRFLCLVGYFGTKV